MAWFFTDNVPSCGSCILTGENAGHISRSLRMKPGEHITLCTEDGRRHECVITSITKTDVTVDILSSTECEQEPDVEISLYVAMLKGDKMDDVIQKSVELGVHDITPVMTSRCISRPNEKALKGKIERWQKISINAASQSRRGIIPKVNPLKNIKELDLSSYDISIIFYECGGEKIRDIIKSDHKKIALITGSEGGFEEEEIESLRRKNVKVATLGKRILRAQTAPIAGMTAILYETKNLE